MSGLSDFFAKNQSNPLAVSKYLIASGYTAQSSASELGIDVGYINSYFQKAGVDPWGDLHRNGGDPNQVNDPSRLAGFSNAWNMPPQAQAPQTPQGQQAPQGQRSDGVPNQLQPGQAQHPAGWSQGSTGSGGGMDLTPDQQNQLSQWRTISGSGQRGAQLPPGFSSNGKSGGDSYIQYGADGGNGDLGGGGPTEIYGPTANGSRAVGTSFPVYDTQGNFLRNDTIQPDANNSMWDLAFVAATAGMGAMDAGLIGAGAGAGGGAAGGETMAAYSAEASAAYGGDAAALASQEAGIASMGGAAIAPAAGGAAGAAGAGAGGAGASTAATTAATTAAGTAAATSPFGMVGSAIPAIAGLVKAVTGAGSSNSGTNTAKNIAEKSDPFSKYRDYYGQKLMDLEKDPTKITSTPGYTAGLQAVERRMASQGYQGSGNMMASLEEFGGKFFHDEESRLAGLAGAGQTPGAGLVDAAGIQSAAEASRQFSINQGLDAALKLLSSLGN